MQKNEDTNGEGRLHELNIPTYLAMRAKKIKHDSGSTSMGKDCEKTFETACGNFNSFQRFCGIESDTVYYVRIVNGYHFIVIGTVALFIGGHRHDPFSASSFMNPSANFYCVNLPTSTKNDDDTRKNGEAAALEVYL